MHPHLLPRLHFPAQLLQLGKDLEVLLLELLLLGQTLEH